MSPRRPTTDAPRDRDDSCRQGADDIVDAWVVLARPADPTADEADALAVRVLARVASLDGTSGTRAAPAIPREAGRRALALTAFAAIALAALGVASSHLKSSDSTHVPLLPDPRASAAEGGRAALLARLEAGGPGSRDAFDRYVRLAGSNPGADVDRLRDACAFIGPLPPLPPDVRRDVFRLLARSPGAAGADALVRLAKDGVDPDGCADALRAMAAGGRPSLALASLRRCGPCAPSVAAAALAIGGSQEIDALLDAPVEVLTSPDVVRALRAATDTARWRVARRAASGDACALALASASRLEELAPALADAVESGRGRLRPAEVDALAKVGGPVAWRLLPLALGQDAGADEAARAALRRLPPAAASAIRDAALERTGARARPYLAALAEVGEAGTAPLVDLARRPGWARAVVEALERTRDPAASAAIAGLSTRTDAAPHALLALTRRLRAGDARAGECLLALASQGPPRAARATIDALVAAGPAAGPSLETALADPDLRRVVLSALSRAGDSPDADSLRLALGVRRPATPVPLS